MSYGFKFLNNNNQTIIDDTSTKPWYWGQASADALYDVTYSCNELNKYDGEGTPYTPFTPFDAQSATGWTVYLIRYTVPSAYNCFVCIELPNTSRAVYYRTEKTHRLVAENPWIDVYAYIPSTVVASAADVPRVYVFVADPVPTANLSTGYGVHVFNSSQQCTYDSNKKHFQPKSIPLVYLPNPRDYVYQSGQAIPGQDTQDLDLPADAAFLLPSALPVYAYYDGNDGIAKEIIYHGIYRRVGQKIRNAMPAISRSNSNANVSLFNASFYNTSGLGLQPIILLDSYTLNQGYTAPEFPASYTLRISTTTLEEGLLNDPSLYRRNVAIITLETAGVANGTLVPYTITGIQSTDISIPLTGNFTVSGNRATVTITALADGLSEGTETATVTLNNGKASIVFTISDLQSFALSVSKANPEEGQSVLVYLNTVNVPSGTVVPYQIGGIQQADLSVGSVSGNFTVAGTGGANGTAAIQLTFARDASPENETAIVTLTNRPEVGVTISITDLSFGYNPVVTIQPSLIEQNQNTTIQITGGIPNDTAQWLLLDSGVDPVDAFNNRWLAAYQDAAEAQVLTLDGYGNFSNTVTGYDIGVGSRVLWIFTQGDKFFRSASVTVTEIPTYSITASNGTKGPLYINEGQTAYFLVTTSNVPNETVVYPKAVNPRTAVSADIINSAENGLTINNNTASFNIQIVADNTTESDPDYSPDGQEYFTLVLDYPNGTRRDTYGTVYINDTSKDPATYRVDRSVSSVNEGNSVLFTFATNQTGTYYWTLTGMEMADIAYAEYYLDYGDGAYWESQGQINSGTISPSQSVRIYFANDQITEGAQTATFDVRSGSITGTVLASNSVTINDTSVYPAAGTKSGSLYCGTGVNSFNLYQNYHNGTGGISATLVEAQSASCGFNQWDEQVTIASDAGGDYIVPTSGYYATTIGQGEPYSAFTFSVTNNSDPQPATFPGSANLNSDGYWTNYIPGYQAISTTEGATGDKRLWVKFAYNNHVRSARILVVENAGTLSGGQYCGTGNNQFNLYQNKHDGRGGIYAETVQTNSSTCGYVQQYYPYMSDSYFYNNLYDGSVQPWYIYGAKPNSTVRFTIVDGPNYINASADITTDVSGFGSFNIGNLAYTQGTYTINATFPNQDASYPSSFRTLAFYWVVYYYDYGGGGGF
jgi:hypothetical protein